MKPEEILEHLRDILLEVKYNSDDKIKKLSEMEFTRIAYNNGVSDTCNKALEFIYKNQEL